MKEAASLQNFEKQAHLKVVKNSLKKKSANIKMYINTLTPGFSYTNHKGETIVNNFGVL
ncbi:hypothetical protein [Lutibacter flavus]|uniref:Uncharacterized protein n=1 Tax=Lutibacter flavus TaxID=691689 RepID=A0A238ZDQ9_9FLAO|nr:hypothetical protein [Lutibacter flavus]SNR81655.1 hypothetical protein SAMN04488111_3274 [Lutibacter flavus]